MSESRNGKPQHELSDPIEVHERLAEADDRGGPAQLTRHFDPISSGRFRVKAPLKNRVSFGHLNLLDEPGLRLLPRMDAIFCRNVLIYLEPAARRKVVHSFWEQLIAGGYLVRQPSCGRLGACGGAGSRAPRTHILRALT